MTDKSHPFKVGDTVIYNGGENHPFSKGGRYIVSSTGFSPAGNPLVGFTQKGNLSWYADHFRKAPKYSPVYQYAEDIELYEKLYG